MNRFLLFPRFTLAVIHKGWKLVIPAWMPKTSVHGWQAIICPLVLIKRFSQLIVTVHGLDIGIPADMTA